MPRRAPILIGALAISHIARADAPAAGAPAPAAGASAPAAGASALTPEVVRGQRFLGIGGEIGFSTGIGPALNLGTRQLGLYVAIGLQPIFIFGNVQGSRALTFDV